MVHGSVNQSFIVPKKGGVISEGECPSQLHTQIRRPQATGKLSLIFIKYS